MYLRVGWGRSTRGIAEPFGPVLEKYQLVRPQNSVRGAQAHGGGRSQSGWLSKKAHTELVVAAIVVELAQGIALV